MTLNSGIFFVTWGENCHWRFSCTKSASFVRRNASQSLKLRLLKNNASYYLYVIKRGQYQLISCNSLTADCKCSYRHWEWTNVIQTLKCATKPVARFSSVRFLNPAVIFLLETIGLFRGKNHYVLINRFDFNAIPTNIYNYCVKNSLRLYSDNFLFCLIVSCFSASWNFHKHISLSLSILIL